MAEPVRYLSAENLLKDDFGVRFSRKPGEIVYDAKTKMGPWATMTQASWVRYGTGKLGLGLGQKYRRTTNGELHKVEG
jgi:hypothetical protein